MIISRVLEVQNGDTVAAVRGFLGGLLEEGVAEWLLAPTEMTPGAAPQTTVMSTAEPMGGVNPLLPVMPCNAAIDLRSAMRSAPQGKFAAVLRPCEVRAVIEMAKRDQMDLDRLIIIGLDCLATHEEAYYHDVTASHAEDPHWLMHESLRFAARGQIAPFRFRQACQFCDRPAPDYSAVDILLGVIGVDARQKVLVIAHELDDAKYKLQRITDRAATERETVEREVAVWTLAQRRKQAADRKLDEMGLTGGNLAGIMGYLASCTLCGDCLDACPLCSEELKASMAQGQAGFLTALVRQSQRLVSCSACGMCQAHCPEEIPLAAISRALAEPIHQRMHYIPGRDVHEPLPWHGSTTPA